MTDRDEAAPAESLNLRLVGHSDMNGNGVTMQLTARGDCLCGVGPWIVGHLNRIGTLR